MCIYIYIYICYDNMYYYHYHYCMYISLFLAISAGPPAGFVGLGSLAPIPGARIGHVYYNIL